MQLRHCELAAHLRAEQVRQDRRDRRGTDRQSGRDLGNTESRRGGADLAEDDAAAGEDDRTDNGLRVHAVDRERDDLQAVPRHRVVHRQVEVHEQLHRPTHPARMSGGAGRLVFEVAADRRGPRIFVFTRPRATAISPCQCRREDQPDSADRDECN